MLHHAISMHGVARALESGPSEDAMQRPKLWGWISSRGNLRYSAGGNAFDRQKFI